MDRKMYGQTVEQTDGQTDIWMNKGWIDRWMGRQMVDRQMNEKTNGQMDE